MMVYIFTRTLILLDLMTSFNFNYLHKLFPNTIMLGLQPMNLGATKFSLINKLVNLNLEDRGSGTDFS